MRKLIPKGPFEEISLKEMAENVSQKSINSFKTGFLTGTRGEKVPFPDIEEGVLGLKTHFNRLISVLLYANKRQSYDFCTQIAENILNQYKSNPRLKGKIKSAFESRAVGPMKGLCCDHLMKLVERYETDGEEGMLELRQKQIRVEQKMLKMLRREAQVQCSQEEFRDMCGSAGSSCSDIQKTGVQPQLSVLDVIRRLPSVDLEDSGRKDESTEERGEVESFVLKQSADESSPPYLSADTAASTAKLD